ncbi:MAG: B12-binding domain-containing radical SAM protein [Candidatus Omnitrophica bacterium]|nr:B12-binding domain-containing radical SAM protein [Candidatus Omnitrophota bacterium]MBU4477870.1 B12-binding domain-containing radical SAM protein [Candidatus Omnitrophota bacterium]MCG2704142.1 B12-binding domain-containing radical SAM protein [Candidatus Omnitrophota bacterium]
MSEIILINCPPWGVVMPPLGIAYLAAYLKSKDISVGVSDLNLKLYQQSPEQNKAVWDLDAINKISPQVIADTLFRNFENQLSEYLSGLEDYPVIGCSANNLISVIFAGRLGRRIKEFYPDKYVVVGGPGGYNSWDRKTVAVDDVDFFVIGEGEEPLYRLVKVLTGKPVGGDDAYNIPGVLACARQKKGLFVPRQYIADLNSIPFPEFKEFDLSEYGSSGTNYRPLPMLISRGCINHCSYCIDCYISSPFRARSPEHIIAELRHHIQNYRITHVEFNDLLCNGNPAQLERLCDLIVKQGFDIRWISYAAIRKNMREELLQKMKMAGCNSLCYGVESGSERILKKMNKHYSRQDACDLIRKTHEAGIEVRLNIIVGFPGETEDDFVQTLEFIRENERYIKQVTNVSSFVLMPGADVGIYPHRFGIRFLDPKDPGKWTDENGLTQEERNKRVTMVCNLLRELKIDNLIINYQKEKSFHIEKKEKNGDLPPINTECIGGSLEPAKRINGGYCRSRLFVKSTVLIFLFIFSIAVDAYLFLLKKIRGSIIFPGS